jgi:hypothetical protein
MLDFTVYENLLTEELLLAADSEIKKTRWQYGWKSDKALEFCHWNMDFGKANGLNNLDITSSLPSNIARIWTYLQFKYLKDYRLIRCYANSHTFGVEGYPHTDSNKVGEKTFVIYMNKEWQRNWGGETMLYDGDSIAHAELPKRNKALLFDGRDWHCARGVTRICPEQRITLMFKMIQKDAIDPIRDKIQTFCQTIGADKTKHSQNNLMSHLLRTYDLLKATGLSQDICSAGGIHSIFGTNKFKKVTVPLENKALLIDIVGAYSVSLAEQFSSLDRPQVIENMLFSNQIGPDTFALAAIEGANLQDQSSLKQFPNLYKYWTGLKDDKISK